MKILISANSFWNFYNFRKDFIFELKKRNHQIVLIAPKDNFYFNYFKSEKISCEIINYKNKTYNPLINILPSSRSGVRFFYLIINFYQILSSDKYSKNKLSCFIFFNSFQKVVFPYPGNPKNNGIINFLLVLL